MTPPMGTPGGSRTPLAPVLPMGRASNQKPQIVMPVIKILMIGSIICLGLHYAFDYGGFRKVVRKRNALVGDREVTLSADGTVIHGSESPGGDQSTTAKDGRSGGTGAGQSRASGRALLVTDAAFPSCAEKADYDVARFALKNKIDYANFHGLDPWYGLGHLRVNGAPSLQPEWSKFVMLNHLWHSHKEREWFVWMNSDAAVLDMGFKIPWSKYKRFDVVLWGQESAISVNVTKGDKSQCQAVDTSVMIVRRSNWSRKLLKSMLALQKQSELEPEQTVSKMRATLSDLPEGPLTPECALSYLLATNTKWRHRIYLEVQYGLREPWTETTSMLEEFLLQPPSGSGPGSGPGSGSGSGPGPGSGPGWIGYKSSRWGTDGLSPPFIISFKGCSFCDKDPGHSDAAKDCLTAFRRAYTFGNTQVMAPLNLWYQTLYDTWVIPRTENGVKVEDPATQNKAAQIAPEAAPLGESSIMILKDAKLPAEENDSKAIEHHVADSEEQIVENGSKSSPEGSPGEGSNGSQAKARSSPSRKGEVKAVVSDVVSVESQSSGKSPAADEPSTVV